VRNVYPIRLLRGRADRRNSLLRMPPRVLLRFFSAFCSSLYRRVHCLCLEMLEYKLDAHSAHLQWHNET
jgi:hypothetical protein